MSAAAIETNLPVRDIRVAVQETTDAYAVGETRTLDGRYDLPAGVQKEIRTDIGPLQDRREAQRFRTQVISAELAQ